MLPADVQRISGRRAEEAAATWRSMITTHPARNIEEGSPIPFGRGSGGVGTGKLAYDAYQDIYWNRSKSPYAREAGPERHATGQVPGIRAAVSHAPTERSTRPSASSARAAPADALDLVNAIPAKALKGDRALDERRFSRVQILYALREKRHGRGVRRDRLLQDAGPRRHGLAALLKASWGAPAVGRPRGSSCAAGGEFWRPAGDDALRAEALHCMGTSAYARGRFAEGAGYFARDEGAQGQPAHARFRIVQACLVPLSNGRRGRCPVPLRAPRRTPAAPDIAGPSAHWSARCSLELGQVAAGRRRLHASRLGPAGVLEPARQGSAAPCV